MYLNRPIKGRWEEFMTISMAQGLVSEAPAPRKGIVVWIVKSHALLYSRPECVAKLFKVCRNRKQSRWVLERPGLLCEGTSSLHYTIW